MLVPATRYTDCDAALIFLRDVLELREHAVYRDESGAIVHAQMGLGAGLMMFGPATDSEFGRLMISPESAGGRETTTIYAVVPDVEALHGRIEACGASIVMPLASQDHGDVSFSVRDPEGHVWTFGDYDPTADGT